LAEYFWSDSRFINTLREHILDELRRLSQGMTHRNKERLIKEYLFTEPKSLRKYK
jgi:hypothetical protein